MAEEIKICGTCKFWGVGKDYTKLRKCEAAKHQNDYLEKNLADNRMYANDLEDFGEVVTGEKFGCIMWEEKTTWGDEHQDAKKAVEETLWKSDACGPYQSPLVEYLLNTKTR